MAESALRGSAKAQTFVVELLRKPRPGGAGRLPGIRSLAAQCGVAPRTMWGVIRGLADQGLVTVVPGGGILPSAARKPGEPAPALPSVNLTGLAFPRWRKLRDQIAHDARAGAFTPGRPLPTAKELCVRYGVCHATLRKALTALHNDHLIQPRNRGYHLTQPARLSHRSALVLIAQTDSVMDLAKMTPRSREFCRVLEQECVRLNLLLEVQPIARYLRPAGTASPITSGTGPVVGYLVWTVDMDERPLPALLARLSTSGLPVSVLDESRQGLRPDLLRLQTASPLRAYALGFDELPGEIVGEHLLHFGHGRAASFQLARTTVWCRNRTAGLRNAFVRAGLPHDAVSPFVPLGVEAFEQIGEAMGRWSPVVALRKNKQVAAEAVSLSHGWDAGMLFSQNGQLRLWGQFLRQMLEPLFATALSERSITAWVAANDVVGLLALDFLKRNGVRVPRQVSVVAFDDSNEAFVSGLSSYNFNVPALVLAMLEHILPVDRRKKRSVSAEHVHIPGQVMQRQSSGPAR
jgi:DNA-binding GntR family transcriptional regulator